MGILDKDFKYIPAAQTDIAKTFKRIKREMEDAKKVEDARLKSIMQNIRPIARAK